MDNKFQTQEELFNYVLPALRTKKHELNRIGLINIKEQDIWNYNKNKKWKKENSLSLYSIVDDILNTTNEEYIDYIENKGEN